VGCFGGCGIHQDRLLVLVVKLPGRLLGYDLPGVVGTLVLLLAAVGDGGFDDGGARDELL